MSLDFFGAGEYPYKTILKDTTCESICYDLDELGYHSHAIHNNTGTFYSRNKVFPKLGFESFSSIEYMENVEYNPLGWAKDKVLTTEIVKALKATKEKDFIYTISVQPHGKYPDNVIDENQFITMSGDVEDVALIQYEYYIEQLHETDLFVKELLASLEKYKEPTIVVLFGDHLPSLDIEDVLKDLPSISFTLTDGNFFSAANKLIATKNKITEMRFFFIISPFFNLII